MIQRLQVQMTAGMVGDFSSPELTLCADSCLVSVPSWVSAATHKKPRSFCQKCRCQVMPKHLFTLDPTKLEWAEYAACCPGIV